MRTLSALLICALFITAVPLSMAQESQLPITLTDAEGKEVTIESLDRIASGSGDVTEIIYELGFYENLVGVDSTSTYPASALEDYNNIGVSRFLTAEGVAAVDPTVFFCTQTCSPAAVIEQIRELGIPVVIIPDSDEATIDLPFQKIDMLAAALGVPERGEALTARVQREIEWAHIATANVEDTPAVMHLYLRDRGLQLAGGAGTPAQPVIEGAKAIDAGAEVGVEYYQFLTPEVLFEAYPEVLLLTRGSIDSIGGVEAVLEIQGVADTPAAEDENIVVMDTLLLLGLSTRVGQAMLELAFAIHPDMTWEREIAYPYTFTDATGTEHTIAEALPLYVENPELAAIAYQLGFHPPAAAMTDESGLLLLTESEYSEEQAALIEAGVRILVLPDDFTVAAVAAALNVPGRGQALEAFLAQ